VPSGEIVPTTGAHAAANSSRMEAHIFPDIPLAYHWNRAVNVDQTTIRAQTVDAGFHMPSKEVFLARSHPTWKSHHTVRDQPLVGERSSLTAALPTLKPDHSSPPKAFQLGPFKSDDSSRCSNQPFLMTFVVKRGPFHPARPSGTIHADRFRCSGELLSGCR
jgi:hypothetical protein